MTNVKLKRYSRVGDRVQFHLNEERIQGHSKERQALWYGHFEVLDKVFDNAYRVILSLYMLIYLVANMENL